MAGFAGPVVSAALLKSRGAGRSNVTDAEKPTDQDVQEQCMSQALRLPFDALSVPGCRPGVQELPRKQVGELSFP